MRRSKKKKQKSAASQEGAKALPDADSRALIESGLDMPRVNTLLVNRADRFGLSQLYQLRGRIGRSDLQAYAYLMVPPGGVHRSLARRRLAAVVLNYRTPHDAVLAVRSLQSGDRLRAGGNAPGPSL